MKNVLPAVLCLAFVVSASARAKGDAQKDATGPAQALPGQAVYVTSDDGLNLRETAGVNTKIIKALKPNTRLVILEKSPHEESVDGIRNFWYKVDTGSETGWVFGAHIGEQTEALKTGGGAPPADKFPLEMELSWADHGEEYTAMGKRAISRLGYVIYLLPGVTLWETDKYDYIGYGEPGDISWLSMRIYAVKTGARVPERSQTTEEARWYLHFTAGKKTLEIEFKALGEAMYGGAGPVNAMSESIRPLE